MLVFFKHSQFKISAHYKQIYIVNESGPVRNSSEKKRHLILSGHTPHFFIPHFYFYTQF